MHKVLCKKDYDGSVYMWEGGGNIYTSLSTTRRTHGYKNEWVKIDDRVNVDKKEDGKEKIKTKMEGEIEVWSRKMQTE